MNQTKTLNARILWGGLVLGLALSLTGCSSPSASKIKTFSEACIVTVSNTTEAFQLAQHDYIRREISAQVLNYGTNGINPADIKPFYHPQALQVRLAILQGLETYAANLSTIVGDSALASLDQNTTELGTTLVQFNTNLVQESFMEKTPVSTEDIQIFTTAINALGHWIISYEQQKSAKLAISQMQPAITNICRLLLRDFDTLESEIDSDNLKNLENEDLFVQKYLSAYENDPSALRRAVQNENTLYQQEKNEHELIEAMKSSILKMQSTHAKLEKVFSDDASDIDSMINEFSAEARRVNDYYQSLKTTE